MIRAGVTQGLDVVRALCGSAGAVAASVAVLFLATLWSAPSLAQSSAPAPLRQWWLGVSAGLADGGGESGTLGLSSLNFGSGRHQIELRSFYYENTTIGDALGDVIECVVDILFGGCEDRNVASVDEWGLLYGRRLGDGSVIVAGGIGRADYESSLMPSADRHDVTTLPLELSWSFGRRSWRGFHLKLAASWSREETVYGIAFGADIGQLRGW